ncbi:hypothetical protein Tco_1093352 [Tanacetum coccineum]|uniref:Uncharacterized protein n=1 Tax=Tanacetum coccineum TaxID=301880 RepID=A0ABQ5IDR0_9ASTR
MESYSECSQQKSYGKRLKLGHSDYKFGMEIPDTMISGAIKKLAGYKFYMDKKVEIANVLTSLKKDVVPRKTRSQTVIEETIVGELANSISIQEPCTQQRRRSQLTIDRQLNDTVGDTYVEWGQKLKGPVVDDPAVQSLLDLRKGSKASKLESLKQKKQAIAGEGSSAAHNKYYDSSDNDSEATLYFSSSDKTEESENETDDADKSDMDLSDDNPNKDDGVVGYGVFMHNKSTATPNSTYLSLTVTTSSLDFIQTLLDETPANELRDFMSHPVYINAQTTSVVHNPKGNPELTSYILGASEVPLGTHVDVLATKTLLQEMFLDENVHHLSYPLATKMSYPTTYPQPSSLQAKAKKLIQKAKHNMRKINFKKPVAHKFKEYDQKLEALINFNVSEAFEKAV